MRMKDEPEVEEEEEEDEEEEREKEEDERGKMEAGSSRLQQETELEDAMQEARPPTDLTCSIETKTHGNFFSFPCCSVGHLHRLCLASLCLCILTLWHFMICDTADSGNILSWSFFDHQSLFILIAK